MGELFTADKINDQIVRIHLPRDVYAYYLEGDEKGLLIDTGYGYGDLKVFVDSISSKPYDVAVTHGHVDHAGGAVQFDKVYLNELDISLAEIHTEVSVRISYLKAVFADMIESEMLPAKLIQDYMFLKNGQKFELGGLDVEFVTLAGHTQGSMVALIPKFKMMVLGDALNSMTFLHLPESSTIEMYKNNLIQFNKVYRGKYDYILYSHSHNIGDDKIIEEMIELCDEIMGNPLQGTDFSELFGEGTRIAKPFDPISVKRLDGKTANMIYSL